MKKTNWLFLFASLLLLLVPVARILAVKYGNWWQVDLVAYSTVSRALFEGRNPFPNNYEVLFLDFGKAVPIVYPGQMLLFALPGFLWSDTIQILYLAVNIVVIYLLTALTLVKACGFQWRDLWIPGKKQFLYALCCFSFFFSNCAMIPMRIGQISLILTFCLYAMFWGPASRSLQTILFAIIATAKYSMLTVFAPLIFFKGHWKLCIVSFSLFVLLSLSPALCGNNLAEVYKGYWEQVAFFFQPGQVNHYDANPMMCHLGFFKITLLNHLSKAIALLPVLWLFWRERKTNYLSDTLLLLALNLTMLISYHGLQDMVFVFPLLFIRLFDFAKNRQWRLFSVTALFLLYLDLPGRIPIAVSSWIGGLPGLDSIMFMSSNPWGSHYRHVFPLTPFFTIALTLWSMYLYFYVKEPYHFEIKTK